MIFNIHSANGSVEGIKGKAFQKLFFTLLEIMSRKQEAQQSYNLPKVWLAKEQGTTILLGKKPNLIILMTKRKKKMLKLL